MSIENGLSEQMKFDVKEAAVKFDKKSEYPLPEKPLMKDVSGKSKPGQKKKGMEY